MTKHYLQYLTDVMAHQWNDAALTDYNENHEYTFGGLAIEMLRLHVLFEQLGIKRGDKIALCGRNCANWAVAYLAIAAYEGVCVSILQDFTAEDIAHLLDHSDSELLFVGPYVWKELQNQTMPAKLKATISLEDWRVLYKGEGLNMGKGQCRFPSQVSAYDQTRRHLFFCRPGDSVAYQLHLRFNGKP